MKKNINGFLMLVVLSCTIPLVGATIPEVLNLIANYKEYTGALIISVIGFVASIVGSMAYGILIDDIKKHFK